MAEPAFNVLGIPVENPTSDHVLPARAGEGSRLRANFLLKP